MMLNFSNELTFNLDYFADVIFDKTIEALRVALAKASFRRDARDYYQFITEPLSDYQLSLCLRFHYISKSESLWVSADLTICSNTDDDGITISTDVIIGVITPNPKSSSDLINVNLHPYLFDGDTEVVKVATKNLLRRFLLSLHLIAKESITLDDEELYTNNTNYDED